MIVDCAYCFKEVNKKPVHVRKNINNFCSKKHNILFMKKNAFNKNCEVCGKVFYCQPCQVRLRNRKTCSMECKGILKKRIARKLREENGFTKHQIDRCLRYSTDAENWRKAVFERDNFICQMCFKRGGYLEADHIKPWAYFPELRFELNNGRTLCRKCHDTTKISSKAMRKLYGYSSNPIEYSISDYQEIENKYKTLLKEEI